jgi:hypothetical protein
MPTIAAKNALTGMWPIIFASRSRQLIREELVELRRLCDVLMSPMPGHDEFNEIAEQLCLAIHSSAVFESGRAKEADRLLGSIDELRRMIS